MINLTAEYLDKQVDKQKNSILKELDKKMATIHKDLKEDIENLAAMTTRGLEEISRKLDVRERVEKLERKMDRVNEALNL